MTDALELDAVAQLPDNALFKYRLKRLSEVETGTMKHLVEEIPYLLVSSCVGFLPLRVMMDMHASLLGACTT